LRIVHLTDLHVQTRPRLRDLPGKRLVGSANLYLLGRRRKFSVAAQRAAVAAAAAAEPDLVICTGDLTAQALDAEFAAARDLLAPLLDRIPTVVIAGNHDTYVREPTPAARMRRFFGEWMTARSPGLAVFGDVAVLTLESCRTHVLSSGRVEPSHLDRARGLLAEAAGRFCFLALHYPLVGRDGAPYGPATRALENGSAVTDFLNTTPGVGAVLHGHEHHGFRSEIRTARGGIPVLNPGASGYAWLPEMRRTGHMNIYEVQDGGLTDVRRLSFDGVRFSPEEGGAYATGR